VDVSMRSFRIDVVEEAGGLLSRFAEMQ